MSDDRLDVVLVSLRDVDDPMALHEELCVMEATGLSELRTIHASDEPLTERELHADLILFGGSGAYSVLDPHAWVKRFLDFLLDVIDAGTPAWGSCYGFQGLALAMGGRVVRDTTRMRMGGYPVQVTDAAASDPLFGPLPAGFDAQFGHKDHVDELPSGVTLLATDPSGRNEAFHVDGSLFWGAQFHPELTSHKTLDRFRHYQHLYDDGEGEAIARRIASAVDDPQVPRILERLVALARDRRAQAGT